MPLMMRVNVVLGVCLGTLLLGFSTISSRHVNIPIPDGLEEDILGDRLVADKHLTQRFSQWYHKRQQHAQKRCGLQDIPPINPHYKIVGGRQAIPGSWPWMVSIYQTTLENHICGGSLIDERWVLTAAHCFDMLQAGVVTYSSYIVRAGKTLLDEEEDTEQDLEIEKVIIHRFYNIRTLDNDIALVKLTSPARKSQSISLICLPSPNAGPLEHWKELVATGWGATKSGGIPGMIKMSSTLRQVALPLIPRQTCQNFNCCQQNLTESMFCAGYELGGRDTCDGDSGSPLQFQNFGKWFIKGIVSWGGAGPTDCAQPMKPGVYTDVFQFVSWILWEMFLHK